MIFIICSLSHLHLLSLSFSLSPSLTPSFSALVLIFIFVSIIISIPFLHSSSSSFFISIFQCTSHPKRNGAEENMPLPQQQAKGTPRRLDKKRRDWKRSRDSEAPKSTTTGHMSEELVHGNLSRSAASICVQASLNLDARARRAGRLMHKRKNPKCARRTVIIHCFRNRLNG